jgi:hypothetical protein
MNGRFLASARAAISEYCIQVILVDPPQFQLLLGTSAAEGVLDRTVHDVNHCPHPRELLGAHPFPIHFQVAEEHFSRIGSSQLRILAAKSFDLNAGQRGIVGNIVDARLAVRSRWTRTMSDARIFDGSGLPRIAGIAPDPAAVAAHGSAARITSKDKAICRQRCSLEMQPSVRKTKARRLRQSRTTKPTETAVRVGRHLEQRVARVEHGPAREAERGPRVANIGANARAAALSSGQGQRGCCPMSRRRPR